MEFTGNTQPWGWLKPSGPEVLLTPETIRDHLIHLNRGFLIFQKERGCFLVTHGDVIFSHPTIEAPRHYHPLVAIVPPMPLTRLGDASFCRDYGFRYPYVAGSMANGISSVEMVMAMGKAGMLGFFGSAGMSLDRVEHALDQLNTGSFPFGVNLIHSPNEPYLEEELVSLLIRKNIRLIEASAYMELTLPLIRYRLHGIHRSPDGRIIAPHSIIAKVSRVEVARRFLSPAPPKYIQTLLAQQAITAEQAELAAHIPLAQDITAEADSGGHTDNQQLITLLPTLTALRDQLQAMYSYTSCPRIGAAGGISTPASAAAAFSMGAAYILTGSINQSCRESGTSDTVRAMLAETRQADIAMAPAADMFEMGVKVQVLKRGTMFPMKALKLYETYKKYPSIDAIPPAEKIQLEKTCFHASMDDIWNQTTRYFTHRDPAQIQRADRDPKYRMALIFRWYLGNASLWAITGDPIRKVDYQIWCGPAMGAFNQWVAGSFLEAPANRDVATIALNILWGAAVIHRSRSCCGLAAMELAPLPVDTLNQLVSEERNPD